VTTEIEVEIVHALPDACESLKLRLPEGSTVGDALRLAGERGFAPALQADAGRLAVFGRSAGTATRLHRGDRIEILRRLVADPKQRRRERAGARKP
jgi:putative ubiquitin-RnfH superfamily antitoxin RatB of RatAB toxin-antitoxin module